ncbi:hypothetical protein A2U01_0011433, partial [Trifolium medium]|nr:hypothetical protein [Trifolium medium]
VTQGFQPVNPTTLDVKKVVMKELRNNQFKGDNSQDPWEHLVNFKEACALQKQPDNITEDQKKLFLFSYSLTKHAKDWLYCLPTMTIRTWKELEGRFLDRFFTRDQYKERKAELMNFQQHRKESLYQSYERFKLLKRRCPNHRICAAELMYIFINGIKQKQRMFLDASARGSVQNKTLAEVEELIQNMCQNQYNKMEDDEEDLLEQLEEMKHKEQLERINKLQKEEELRSKEQRTQETRLEVMMMQLTQTMVEQMQALAEKVSKIENEQCKAIELRNRTVYIVEKPKKDKTSKTSEVQNSSTQEITKDIEGTDERTGTTQESEQVVQNDPQPTPVPHPVYANPKPKVIVIPYPSKDEKKEIQKEQNRKFEGYITQMEIIVPLKDMLQISPPFHKFVKNLVGGKIQLLERGTVMLTEECSALFQKTIPRKCKDPGSITVPCSIGGVEIGQALCDLGASVNLMPLSIMKK